MKLTIITSLLFSALSSYSNASVYFLISDDGNDLTVTLYGDFDLTGITSITSRAFQTGDYISGTGDFYQLGSTDPHYFSNSTGNWSGNDIAGEDIINIGVNNSTNMAFGFAGNNLIWDVDYGATGTITPLGTAIFEGWTESEVFGNTLAAGPVLLWTADFGINDTIYIARANSIPEPTSTYLIGIGLFSLTQIRHRKNGRTSGCT